MVFPGGLAVCRLCATVAVRRDLWGSADPSRGQGIAARSRRDAGCLTDAIVSGKCTMILVDFVLGVVLHLLLVRLERGVAGRLCASEILAMGCSASPKLHRMTTSANKPGPRSASSRSQPSPPSSFVK
jgi:hypothetical protein